MDEVFRISAQNSAVRLLDVAVELEARHLVPVDRCLIHASLSSCRREAKLLDV